MKKREKMLILQPEKRDTAFGKTMPKAGDMRQRLRDARKRECLIPSNDEDGPCGQKLNNSHLIGESHLRPIAENGHVYEWDPTDINNIVSAWMLNGWPSMSKPYNISLGRLRPANLNIRKCTRKVFCTRHDGPVFEGIDAAKLNVHSLDHQFLLGFRAVSGTLGLYESVLDFVEELNYPQEVEFWKERGQWNDVEHHLDEQTSRVMPIAEEIAKYVRRWQQLYLDGEQGGLNVITAVKQFTPAIRIACSSIYRTEGRPQFALTIIPSQDRLSATAIVSSLKKSGWKSIFGGDRSLRGDVETICTRVSKMIQGEGYCIWLKGLTTL